MINIYANSHWSKARENHEYRAQILYTEFTLKKNVFYAHGHLASMACRRKTKNFLFLSEKILKCKYELGK